MCETRAWVTHIPFRFVCNSYFHHYLSSSILYCTRVSIYTIETQHQFLMPMNEHKHTTHNAPQRNQHSSILRAFQTMKTQVNFIRTYNRTLGLQSKYIQTVLIFVHFFCISIGCQLRWQSSVLILEYSKIHFIIYRISKNLQYNCIFYIQMTAGLFLFFTSKADIVGFHWHCHIAQIRTHKTYHIFTNNFITDEIVWVLEIDINYMYTYAHASNPRATFIAIHIQLSIQYIRIYIIKCVIWSRWL